jgi:hypothetical protein
MGTWKCTARKNNNALMCLCCVIFCRVLRLFPVVQESATVTLTPRVDGVTPEQEHQMLMQLRDKLTEMDVTKVVNESLSV